MNRDEVRLPSTIVDIMEKQVTQKVWIDWTLSEIYFIGTLFYFIK